MIHCCRLCGVAEKESFWEVLLRKDAGGVSVVTRVSEAFSGFFFLSFVSGVGFFRLKPAAISMSLSIPTNTGG